ncbi:DUF309 domain-containing protein [Cohnella faecalis]|nr:DUF309 domain-containing protein [Cohnella faecalis]
MNVSNIYPAPYLAYLSEYHGSRDYFECHEIMEEYWKERTGDPYSGCWLVFIRIAVACYHARRSNWSGALKMLNKAAAEIEPERMDELGLDGRRLSAMVHERAAEWADEDNRSYSDLDFPFADSSLEEECKRICERKGWKWRRDDHLSEDDLVHRHSRRDRSDVIEARQIAAAAKSQSRS